MVQPPAPIAEPVERLRAEGYALLAPDDLCHLVGVGREALDALAPSWNALPPDPYLLDGGRYRFRRHASYTVEPDSGRVERCPHRAHWQPTTYNALHGGLERWFEPLAETVGDSETLHRLLSGLGRAFARVRPAARWFVEVHAFRIDTEEGIGRPTPEGAHRDGVDFVAVLLVDRHAIIGGETRVFEADGPRGVRFTIEAPWSALLLDDTRVIHETTPIRPAGEGGRRDTLVVTFRAGGFQDPDAG